MCGYTAYRCVYHSNFVALQSKTTPLCGMIVKT